MNKWRPLAVIASIVAISGVPAMHADGAQYQVLRAANVHELIADMIIAAHSGQPTQIRLAQGHYTFSSAYSVAFDGSYLPEVIENLQIIGSDASKTVLETDQSSTQQHRFFMVAKNGSLALYKVTLSDGVERCDANDCLSQGGGAVLNLGGRLEFHDCVLSDNAAFQAQGGGFRGGGAILNLGGTLVIDGTQLYNNGALNAGGTLYLHAGNTTISNSIISGSHVDWEYGARYAAGAAIYVDPGASLRITGSTISGGTGGRTSFDGSVVSGFGIHNSGDLTLITSAVVDNVDDLDGGSPYAASAGAGGGIYNDGTARIINTTIAGNAAGTLGGGIYNAGTLVLQGSTITDNNVYGTNSLNGPYIGFPPGCSALTYNLCVTGGAGVWNEPTGVLSITTSVIGENQGEDCHGTLTTVGHNAVGNSTNCTLKRSPVLGAHASYDLVNVNVRLGERMDDGTAGNTHYPPLADSPLIDAGGPVGPTCTPQDQIGNPRVDGNADHNGTWKCDIGAIEFQPPPQP